MTNAKDQPDSLKWDMWITDADANSADLQNEQMKKLP